MLTKWTNGLSSSAAPSSSLSTGAHVYDYYYHFIYQGNIRATCHPIRYHGIDAFDRGKKRSITKCFIHMLLFKNFVMSSFFPSFFPIFYLLSSRSLSLFDSAYSINACDVASKVNLKHFCNIYSIYWSSQFQLNLSSKYWAFECKCKVSIERCDT